MGGWVVRWVARWVGGWVGGWVDGVAGTTLALPIPPDPTLPLSQATPTARLVPPVSSDIRVHLDR